MDREKVIGGLAACTGETNDCAGHTCPYWDFDDSVVDHGCRIQMELDALAMLKEQQEQIDRLIEENASNAEMAEGLKELLKEQEAVEPKTEPSAKGYWYTCGVCGWWLFEVRDTVHFDVRKRIRFCPSCGRAVKWE